MDHSVPLGLRFFVCSIGIITAPFTALGGLNMGVSGTKPDKQYTQGQLRICRALVQKVSRIKNITILRISRERYQRIKPDT